MIEHTPGDQRVRGSNPPLGKNFLAINYTASNFATIVWPEGEKTLWSTWVLDCGQVESRIGKKKYCHNINPVVKEKFYIKIINKIFIPTGWQPLKKNLFMLHYNTVECRKLNVRNPNNAKIRTEWSPIPRQFGFRHCLKSEHKFCSDFGQMYIKWSR